MSSFLGQYYGAEEGREIPAEVLTPLPVEDDGALDALFAERTGRRVALRTPKRGRLVQLLATARANAELGLQPAAGGPREPRRGLRRAAAGARAAPPPAPRSRATTSRPSRGRSRSRAASCSGTGSPRRPDFRRYRIREAAPDDDLACLREVLARRLARAESEPLPDLMLVDGGKGQLSVLSAALADAGLETDAISLAKERDAREPLAAGAALGRAQVGARLRPRPPGSGRRCRRARAPCCCCSASATSRTASRSSSSASCARRRAWSRSSRRSPGSGRASAGRCCGSSARCGRCAARAPERLAAVSGISARDAATLRGFFDAADGTPRGGSGSSGAGPAVKRGPAPSDFPGGVRACFAWPAGSASRSRSRRSRRRPRSTSGPTSRAAIHFTQDLNQVPARHRSQAELRALAPPEAGRLQTYSQPAAPAPGSGAAMRAGAPRRGARSAWRWRARAPG